MRLYRENLALKVQLDTLAAEVTRVRGKRARVALRTRASQVWVRSRSTICRLLRERSSAGQQGSGEACRGARSPRRDKGAPRTAEEIVELVLTVKRENMHWGQKRISQELRRMGVQVSAPTV
ncbi:MAG: hypothetical protein JW940_25475, partial [Polyangiaceae bacterium]|nr:hypothetical protein [Polyangiaceae bacterium]